MKKRILASTALIPTAGAAAAGLVFFHKVFDYSLLKVRGDCHNRENAQKDKTPKRKRKLSKIIFLLQ